MIWEWRQSTMIGKHDLRNMRWSTGSRKSRQEIGPGYLTLWSTPIDPLPPTSLLLLKVPQHWHTVPPVENHEFEHVILWGIFFHSPCLHETKPQISIRLHVYCITHTHNVLLDTYFYIICAVWCTHIFINIMCCRFSFPEFFSLILFQCFFFQIQFSYVYINMHTHIHTTHTYICTHICTCTHTCRQFRQLLLK